MKTLSLCRVKASKKYLSIPCLAMIKGFGVHLAHHNPNMPEKPFLRAFLTYYMRRPPNINRHRVGVETKALLPPIFEVRKSKNMLGQ